jgi:hypothetical protein
MPDNEGLQAYYFVQGIIETFSSRALINRAIRKRRLLLDYADINSSPTLESLRKQFDAEGNLRDKAACRFIDDLRLQTDYKYLLRDENTDRERIALISIYQYSADCIVAPADTIDLAVAEALQLLVSRQIRHVAGFTKPLGYKPKPEMITELNSLRDQCADLQQRALLIAKLIYELRSCVPPLAAVQRRLRPKPDTEIINQSDLRKYAFIRIIFESINKFSRTHDFVTLFSKIKEIKRLNDRQLGDLNCRKRITPLINNMYGVMVRHEPLIMNSSLQGYMVQTFFREKLKHEALGTPSRATFRR